MSLGKLLATGRSMVNSGVSAVYHEDKTVYLPRFGPGKNPFITMQQELPKPTAEYTVTKKVPVCAKTQKIPSLAAPKKVSWMSKLNPLAMFRQPKNELVSRGPRPVQVE